MENFTYHIPTVIHFGRGQLGHLAELRRSGTGVLLVYGGGSIKRSGLYDAAMKVLTDAGLTVTELSGVEPNPRIESVRRGAALCRERGIEMVLAIGGGSIIDCAKMVAAGACYDGDPWDLVLDGEKIRAALPVYTVLTIAATGSEMDEYAVVSDLSKNEKWDTCSPLIRPAMSILDPTCTFTVSRRQTAAGTADIISHTLENYFTNVPGAALQGYLCEAVLKTCFRYGPIALERPEDYEARANLMWAGSLAINGLLNSGAGVGWCVHPIEHELSAFYDITHGEGLAILTPVWMRFILEKDPARTEHRLAAYGRAVFGLTGRDGDAAREAVSRTASFFFDTMGMPATLREVGIPDGRHFSEMAAKAAAGCRDCFVPLSEADIAAIYQASL